ncbi:MAG: hypothetical protein AAFZ07_25665 [Actinomycetota bacterium]
MPTPTTPEEQAYADLADEMNDADVPYSDWAHFNDDVKDLGARYAAANHLPWPPSVGDFDRWYEMKNRGEL